MFCVFYFKMIILEICYEPNTNITADETMNN
jgi:hypothetical protein